MPRYDRTGPEGQGAMTGRRMGVCTGNVTVDAQEGLQNRPGAGLGRGRAGGRGFGGGAGRGRGGGFGKGRGRV